MPPKAQPQYVPFSLFILIGLFAALFSHQTHAVTITVSGTLYSDEGITPITTADQTIHLIVEGVSVGTNITDNAGNYAITATISPSNTSAIPLLVYIDDETIGATTVTIMNSVASTTLSSLDIYTEHLILRQNADPTRALNTGDMANAKVALSDPDILYNITWPDTTVTGVNTKLYIANGYIYEPAGNVSTHHLQIEGTLNGGSNTFNLSGDWDFTNGTFNLETSTVNFTGSSTIRNNNTAWWSKRFYNVTASAAGQTTTILLGKGIVVQNVFTLGTGTLAGGSVILNKNSGIGFVTAGATLANSSFKYSPWGGQANIVPENYPNLWLAGGDDTTFALLGDITCNDLTLYGNGSGQTTTLDTTGYNISCNRLTIGNTSDRKGKLTLSDSTLTVHNDLTIMTTITESSELDAGNGTLFIGGDWINNDLFTAGISTVVLKGNTNQQITSGGDAFYNLTIENTGVVDQNNVTLQDPLAINNNLLVTTGKLNTSTNNLPITVLNNLNQTATGEIEAQASTITVTGDVSVDGTLDSTNYNDASLILNGTGSLAYNNISQRWRNGFNNLTAGQTGQNTSTSDTFTVFEQLTIGSGELAGSSMIYLGDFDHDTLLNFDPNATISINELRFFGRNQTIPPLNNGYDCNIRLSRGNLTVTQTGNITINTGNHLIIDGDNFVDRAVTYNTNGFNLNIGGGLFLGATSGDTALKTLDISNSNITVARNFEIRPGTNDLISTNSTITLNGTGAQAVTMKGKSFDQLILTNTATSGVTFNDGFTTNTLTNTTPNSTMTFAAGQDYIINNAVTLQGASGQLLNLVSSSPGTHWNFILNTGASKNISNVNVLWSDASGSHSTQKLIDPSNSTDGGNNIDWFPASELSVTKESTLISDPINGSSATKNHIPGAIVEYRVTVQNSGTASPDANTVMVYDSLDTNVEYDVATGVVFEDGSISSALTLGTISYAHRTTPTIYTYTPVGAFDPNVASIKIETNGSFAFGGSPAPEFSVTFRVRIK